MKLEDVAEVALLFAAFISNALTGRSLIVSHGRFMQQLRQGYGTSGPHGLPPGPVSSQST